MLRETICFDDYCMRLIMTRRLFTLLMICENYERGNTMHNYLVIVTGIGGEHTIGHISPLAASYWLKEGREKLGNYLFDRAEGKASIDEFLADKYTLPLWCDLDQITHANGPFISEFSEAEVYDASNNLLGSIDLSDDKVGSGANPEQDYYSQASDIGERELVFCQSIEEGRWEYELCLEDRLDIDKLRFSVISWETRQIVSAIEYNELTFYAENCETYTSDEVAWIDSDMD